MNEKKAVSPFLTAFFCALAISVAAAFCVITAFDVPVHAARLILSLLLLSAWFSLLCGLPRGWIGLIVTALLAIGAGYYFRLALFRSASVAIETVSSFYAGAFESIQPITLMETEAGQTATLFFVLTGGFLSLVTAWTVRGQNTLWLAAVCALLPLVLCLVILQSVPAVWAVLLLVGALTLLILTQQLRVRSEKAGGRLAAFFALPLAALMLLLYAFFPQEGYTRSEWSDALAPKISGVADKLTVFRVNEATGQVQFVSPVAPSTLGSRAWDSSVTKANLNRVGPQRLSGRSVMQIYAESAQTYYLRASALGIYEDNTWRAVRDSGDRDADIPEDVFLVEGEYAPVTVRVKTDMKSSVFYTPYALTRYPQSAQPVLDAYIKNPLQQTEYTLDTATNYVNSYTNPATKEPYRTFVYDTYLQIPDSLRETFDEAPEIARQKEDVPASVWQLQNSLNPATAYLYAYEDAVKELVQSGKRYSLDTPRVPDGEDFVTWFLTQSDTGYCVHFATAATMLLRYYGIPARYTTGYLARAEAGVWSTVTQDEAHAWVEVYDDHYGWTVFDPTPAVSETPIEPDTPPETEPDEPQPDSRPPEEHDSEQKPDHSEQNENETSNPTVNIDENEKNSENVAERPEGERSKRGGVLWAILWSVIALAALVFAWRLAVLSARTANLTRGSTNRRAAHYYRHIVMLARLAKEPIPDELTELSQKARFSQHKLEEAELEKLVDFAENLTRRLLTDAVPVKRVLYRLVYVLR